MRRQVLPTAPSPTTTHFIVCIADELAWTQKIEVKLSHRPYTRLKVPYRKWRQQSNLFIIRTSRENMAHPTHLVVLAIFTTNYLYDQKSAAKCHTRKNLFLDTLRSRAHRAYLFCASAVWYRSLSLRILLKGSKVILCTTNSQLDIMHKDSGILDQWVTNAANSCLHELIWIYENNLITSQAVQNLTACLMDDVCK